MTALSYQSHPALRKPVLVCAFGGFGDAGEAATAAGLYLRETWKAEPYASIDPEEFFDFQAHRPLVRLNDEGIREIVWPKTDFSYAPIPGSDRDAILLLGQEPSMRWPTFCNLILEVAHESGAEQVVTLAALFAARPHTRPIRVMGTAATPEVASKYGFATPRYEGPTGIVGVLMDACRRDGLETVTLWSWVPHYLQGGPSPGSSVAVLQRLGSLLDITIDLTELEERAQQHDRRIEAAIRSDPDIAATVEELERQADAEDIEELPSGEELAAEFERFLRNQPGER